MGYRKPDPKPCVRCGTIFTAVKCIKRAWGLQWVAYSAGRTCGVTCGRAWASENPDRKRKISLAFTGEKHWNWQGGKAQLNNISNRGPGWKKRRLEAIMRCGERCVDCDMTRDQCRQAYGRDLDVDHTIPFHNFALHREANRIGNLKARCASCHRVAEATRSDVQMLLPFAPLHRRHKGYVRGEAVNTARLNALQVKAIRQRFAAGETITDLAAEHGMDRSGFYMIVTRRTWKRVA